MTPAANLPYTLPAGTVLNPVTSDLVSNKFPSGWISGNTVYNHYDDGSSAHTDGGITLNADYYHFNYADIWDIPGDVPSESAIYAYNTGGAAMSYLIMAMRSFGTPFYTVPNGEATGSADSTCTDGAKYVTAALAGTWTIANQAANISTTVDPFDRNQLNGRYHVLVRVKDNAAGQGNLRMKVVKIPNPGDSGISNAEVTPQTYSNSTFAIADLGVYEIGSIYDNKVITAINGGLAAYRALYARRVTGTSTIDVDYAVLFPADEFYTTIYSPDDWTTAVGCGVLVSSFEGAPRYSIVRSETQLYAAVQTSGGVPFFNPNRCNRMYFNFSRANKDNYITDSIRVAAKYQARWL